MEPCPRLAILAVVFPHASRDQSPSPSSSESNITAITKKSTSVPDSNAQHGP